VFGRVVKGIGVVDAISKVNTATRGMNRNVPAEAVVITKVNRVK
jgi:cyclophilin family peptidyl-prolyl cis-trans isomerase